MSEKGQIEKHGSKMCVYSNYTPIKISKKSTPVLHKLFNIKEERTPINSFFEARLCLTSKSDINITRRHKNSQQNAIKLNSATY